MIRRQGRLAGKLFRPAAAVTLALGLVATAAGCGTSSGSGSGGVSLRLLAPEYSDKTKGLMQEVVDDFNTANKGKIEVTLETAPWDKLHDKLTLAMGSRKAPDVFGYATRWLTEFESLGQLEPLDERLAPTKDLFNENVLKAGMINGKTYGLPLAVSDRMLYYRTDLFDEAGLKAPKTWDDLMTAAVKTAHPPKNHGLGVPASGVEVDTFFDYFLYNNGGEILDAKGKSLLSSPESVEALQYLTDLVKAGGSEPKPTGFTREQIIEMFKAGQLSMYPTGPWLNAMIQADAPDLKYSITPFPTNGDKPAQAAGVTDSFGMSATSAHKDEAWKFVEFMYQEKYRQKFGEAEGMLPELKSVAASDYFQAPKFKPFVDALSVAKFQPQHPKFEAIQQIMTVAVQKALSGQTSPKSALAEATDKINQL
ncbi:ABC transporter substrate-binding protein [Streptomyces sp. NPDC000880]